MLKIKCIGAITMLLLLNSCSSLPKPEDVLALPRGVCWQRVPLVTIFYATDRQLLSTSPAIFSFGPLRVDALKYGRLVIKVPSQKERAFGEITSEFRIVSNSTFIDEKTFLGALKAYASGNAFLDARREGLLFIHGFDESFERAAFRNAQFVYDGCLQITPILFSWPSRDTFPGYLYDRDSVIFSRDSLAKLIKAAANRNVFARFDVFAHSMGNWAVLEAIRNIYGPSDSTVSHKPMIDNLILASPDIDIDVFRQDLPAAKRAARSVTLFTSRRDFLLGFSQTVAFGDPRVGNASLDTLAVHGITAGSNLRIVAMDERASGDCGAFEHRCSETNPVVMAQIRLILQGN